MKTYLKTLTLLLGSTLGANAAINYVGDFEDPPFNDPINGDIGGTDGWVIDSAVDGISFVLQSWGNGVAPASQAAGLGGYYDSPGAAGTVVNLSHPVSMALTSAVFDVDFAVLPFDLAPGQDSFGWTFMASGNPLLNIAFEVPGFNGDLEIAWYDNAGGRHAVSDIFYNASYHLNVAFAPSGADAGFTFTLNGTNSISQSGILVGEGATQLTDVGAQYTVVDDSDSYMVFDNLAAIPEPQSALLVLVGLVGLAARRRRS